MDEMKILISLKNSSKRNSRVEKNSPMRNCGGGQFRDSLPRGNESTWPCRAWRVHSIFYRVMSRRNIDRVDTNVPPLSLLFFQHGNMAVTSSSYRNYALFTRYSTLWKFPLSSSFSSERKIDFSNGEDQCRFRTKSKDNGISLIANRRIICDFRIFNTRKNYVYWIVRRVVSRENEQITIEFDKFNHVAIFRFFRTRRIFNCRDEILKNSFYTGLSLIHCFSIDFA